MEILLNGYAGCTVEEVYDDIECQYQVERSVVDKYKIIIAIVNEYDYEEDSYFLLLEKSTGKFYENSASHCSCYGFENQFEPTEVELDFLLSKHAYFGNVSDEDMKRIHSKLEVLARWFKIDKLLKNGG